MIIYVCDHNASSCQIYITNVCVSLSDMLCSTYPYIQKTNTYTRTHSKVKFGNSYCSL